MTSNRSDSPLTWLDGTPFRAKRVVGKGAMGVVLLAEHEALGRDLCVKVLRPEASGMPELVDRFRLEAQALAKLGGGRHPNLVEVSDFGTTPRGYWFLAMEHLVGRTLEEERKVRGPIPWGEACQLVLQALAGLAVAHEAGIVHRDIKPANLFVRDPDVPGGPRVVKVLDFGIIKLVEMAKIQVAGLRVPTAAGMTIGTPRYMAPEQLRAGKLDARADVYGISLVFWSLLSGRIPHEGRDGEALVHAQLVEPLRPLREHAEVPDAIAQIIERGSAKKVEHRPRDAGEYASALLDALQRAKSAATAKTTPLPARTTPRGPRGTELVMDAPEALPIVAPARPPSPSSAPARPVPKPAALNRMPITDADEGPTAKLAVREPQGLAPGARTSWPKFAGVVTGAALAAALVVYLLSHVIR